jgi:hypothetical protein
MTSEYRRESSEPHPTEAEQKSKHESLRLIFSIIWLVFPEFRLISPYHHLHSVAEEEFGFVR